MSHRLSRRQFQLPNLGLFGPRLCRAQGSAMLEFMIIFVLVVAASAGSLQNAIKNFNGDQIQVQEVVNAYAAYNGQTFNVSNLGPNGLLRSNDMPTVSSELINLAQGLKVAVGRGGFCAAALMISPPFTTADVSTIKETTETGAACASPTSPQMIEAFAQSVDPLGGDQFAVVVRHPNLFPEISARYQTDSRPDFTQ